MNKPVVLIGAPTLARLARGELVELDAVILGPADDFPGSEPGCPDGHQWHEVADGEVCAACLARRPGSPAGL
jgi:hypothetical protein